MLDRFSNSNTSSLSCVQSETQQSKNIKFSINWCKNSKLRAKWVLKAFSTARLDYMGLFSAVEKRAAANFKHGARSTCQLDTPQKCMQCKNNCNTNSESRAPDSRRSCLDFVLQLLLPYYNWSNFPSLTNLLVTQYYWKMAGSLLTLLCNNRPQISRICRVIAQFLLCHKLTRLYLKLG